MSYSPNLTRIHSCSLAWIALQPLAAGLRPKDLPSDQCIKGAILKTGRPPLQAPARPAPMAASAALDQAAYQAPSLQDSCQEGASGLCCKPVSTASATKAASSWGPMEVGSKPAQGRALAGSAAPGETRVLTITLVGLP